MSVEAAVVAALVMGLLPGYEPRYAVAVLYGLVGGPAALLAALAEVVVLAAALTLAVDKAWALLDALAPRFRVAALLRERVLRRRDAARRLVERYGVAGLAAFIAVPLPVTGMYTGAALGLLLGVRGARLMAALLAGGSASVLLVYALTLLVAGGAA